MDIVVGGSIIIPMDIRVEATTISMTMNGMYIKNPMINARRSSLITKAGTRTRVGMSSTDSTLSILAISIKSLTSFV